MNYLIKGGVATLSIGTITGTSYAGYSHFLKNSFKSKLGISVLNLTSDENSNEWTLRLSELNAKRENLDSTIEALKNKTWKDLRSWCNNNKSNSFNKESDIKYQNFEEFCTWKIGDKTWTNKIASTVADTHDDWRKAHAILKAKNKQTLSNELQVIYDATSTSNADRKAIHSWCNSNYKKTWKNDASFEEIKAYCKSA